MITARFLGPTERGIYTLIFTCAGIVSIVLASGLYQANLNFIAQKKHRLEDIIGNSFLWLGFISAIYLLFLSNSHFVDEYFGSVNKAILVPVIWGATLLLAMTEIMNGIVLGSKLYHSYFMYTIMIGVVTLATIAPMFWGEENAIYLGGFRVVLTFFSIAVAILMVTRKLQLTKPSFNFKLLSLQLAFGRKSVAQNIIGVLNYRAHIFVIAFYLDNSAVGIFSVAMLFVEATRFLPNSIGSILLPHISHQQDDAETSALVARSCRIALLLVVVVGVIILTMVQVILELVFGVEYLAASHPIYIMFTGALLGAVYQILTRYFTSLGKQEKTILAASSALFLTLPLSVFLISQIQLIGAAIAFACGQSIQGFILAKFAARQSKLPVRHFIVPTLEDAQALFSGLVSVAFRCREIK